MNCDEFLDTIDGSENLDTAQQEHVNSCESCKNAFVASAAFVSCRKPLSVTESTKIAVISKMALSASNAPELSTAKASAGISSIVPVILKFAIVAVVIVGATLIISIFSPDKKQVAPQKIPSLSKNLVKIMNHPYAFKTGTQTLDENNCKITFFSPCSFIFTEKGLKITEGQAKFEMDGLDKPITVYSDSDSIKISSGTLLCKIENGKMTVNVLSGVVKQDKDSSAKIINVEQSSVTKPETTESGGVILMSPNDEEVRKIDERGK